MSSFILTSPTVWPQYTNVIDRAGQDRTGQSDSERQRSDSIGRIVFFSSGRPTSSSATAERPRDACSTSNRKLVNFRLKGYVSR